jgi:hypothetical protein
MTSLKALGTWVRLPDGRSGHIAGATIGGLTVIVDGRIVIAAAKDVTAIATPAGLPLPEPVRTQAPIQTHHPLEEPQFPSRPQGLSVLVNDKWSTPQ